MNHMTILYVSDQERSKQFYKNIFLTEPILHVEGMTEFQFGENHLLGLMPYSSIDRLLEGKMPSSTLGAGIPRCELYIITENIASTIERVIQEGGILLSPSTQRNWGHQVAYISDPDGHIIALASENAH